MERGSVVNHVNVSGLQHVAQRQQQLDVHLCKVSLRVNGIHGVEQLQWADGVSRGQMHLMQIAPRVEDNRTGSLLREKPRHQP
eukprot:11134211-Alexandrium_andersonii.AAC.1